jgi:hypothetical protein
VVTLASTVILGSESHGTHDHILLPDGSGSLQTLFRDSVPHKLYILIQFVPHRKHIVSATKINRLMLFREIIAVYCENHTEHMNTLCGQNVELVNVKQVVYMVTILF